MRPRSERASRLRRIYQFLVVLPSTNPLVWRRIQVPEGYSFWDLHIAIQDAMGWQDSHLHEFTVADTRTGQVTRIGIPGKDMPEERPCMPGWEAPVAQHLLGPVLVRDRYDFGDNWEHILELEDILPAAAGKYPRCVGGAGACPPEDVGGPTGYAEFLRAMGDPRHPDHVAMREWVGGGFDPYAFDPETIAFDDPRLRWEMAFEDK